MPTAVPTPAPIQTLTQYAAAQADGLGAIYIGDITRLAGPALSDDLGGYDGDVPLDALERHRWIYESPFYRKLIEKANLIDPTPLTSRGESIEIQHTCRNRALVSCQLLHTYFAPNLDERTNGQVRFYITSFNLDFTQIQEK